MACQHPFIQGNGVFPCYRCKPCLISSADYWRDRQELEYQDTRDFLGRGSSFITLTYRPSALPIALSVRKFACRYRGKRRECWCAERALANGRLLSFTPCEVDEREYAHSGGVLDHAHVERFFKTLNQRLVRHGGTKVRHSGVGEYGEKSGRPHFHAICFGYAPDDLVGGVPFSEHVRASWPHGEKVQVGPLLKGGAHYISGYITGPRSVEGHPALQGRPPEYSFRSPGLGGGAVDRFADEFAKTPFASSIDERRSKPITMRTEFREVWLRKALLRRFFTRLGYADPADIRYREEVRMLGNTERNLDNWHHSWVAADTPAGCPSAAFKRHPELVLVPYTLLARANMSGAWVMTRPLAAARLARIDEDHGHWSDGGNPDVLATAREIYRELHSERVDDVIARDAAHRARSLERRVL